MIKPINNHVLIEPVVHEQSVVVSSKETYEEIGVVIDFDGADSMYIGPIKIGCKVYFDAWSASKYPKTDGGFYWLVKYEDIRAVEYAE